MRLLFVDDEKQLSDIVLAELPRQWVKHAAYTLADARRILEQNIIDVVILDLRLPDGDGLDLLPELKLRKDVPEVFVLTGHGSVPEAVTAMRHGVIDFLTKPVSIDRLEAVVRAGGLRRGVGLVPTEPESESVTQSLPPGLRMLGMQSLQITRTNIPILILGEAGSGKEHFARFVHHSSERGKGPLAVFNAGTCPPASQKTELFGFGPSPDLTQPGVVHAAQNGTLLLKNVSALDMSAQNGLMRMLSTGQFPIAMTANQKADMRIVALADGNLQSRIESQAFREDLYFRLSGFAITIPPLRSRIKDVIFIAQKYISKELAGPAIQALTEYDWPGNVSELQFVVQQAERFAAEVNSIRKHHVESALGMSDYASKSTISGPITLEEMELAHIRRVLKMAGGNQTRAAKLLGIDPKTLYRKLKHFLPGNHEALE
jgi:DNA-binding NtrC family response regulator